MRALSGSADKTLKLWDAQAQLGQHTVLASFTLDSHVSSVALTRRGDLAVTGDGLGQVAVFAVVLDPMAQR